MTPSDKFLDPNESVVWRGSPSKSTVLLQSFAGVWIALFFGTFAFLMLNFGVPLFDFPIILIAFSFAIVIIPPIWKLSNLPKTEYLVTNKRLIKITGINTEKLWSAKLDNIKEVIVKRGVIDRILGTGKLYPITAEYPYAPKIYAYSRGGMYNLKKVYNITTGTYDEITQIDLYRKSITHPHLEGIKQPYSIQKIVKENSSSSI